MATFQFNRWPWREEDILNLTPKATRDYLEAMADFNEERRREFEEIERKAGR